MAHTLHSAAVVGLDAVPIAVEADAVHGLPSCTIVGLPDISVREARERVRAAITNSGIPFPRKRVTINLAPADVRKEGSLFDLPIALAIFLADDQLSARIREIVDTTTIMIVGELALSGEVRPIRGALAVAHRARASGATALFLPRANIPEARLIDGITLYPVDHVRDVIDHWTGEKLITPDASEDPLSLAQEAVIDMTAIVGQAHAKRALVVAASGRHNMLMTGPPGSGKTMLAQALAGILPPLRREEVIDVTRIWSVCGMLKDRTSIMRAPPFRSPHHSASLAALIGGGTHPRPGEVSLAHRGVLFLDEFPEFPRTVLESLRQPLEEGTVTVARARDHITFPASFLLVAAQNPCPCGYLNDPVRACVCPPGMLTRYQGKVSGPLLDRIDLMVPVPRLAVDEYDRASANLAPESPQVRAQVEAARGRQAQRFAGALWSVNADMPSAYIRAHLAITDAARDIFRSAVQRFHMSGRVYFRILKVARTIADLSESDVIDTPHIAEALGYRFQEN